MTLIVQTGIVLTMISIFIAGSTTEASKTVQICESPAVKGNRYCRTDEDRWTFSSEDEKCEVLGRFGGCGATENNFGSEKDCLKTCGGYKGEPGKRAKTYPAACSLPSGQTGMCRAAINRYFYDQKSKSCEEYTYGGCGGNANSFKYLADCERYCVKSN